MTEREKAVVRVRKLFALAHDSGATAAEVAVARSRIEHLRAKYSIHVAEIQAQAKPKPAAVFDELIRRAREFEQRKAAEAARAAEERRAQEAGRDRGTPCKQRAERRYRAEGGAARPGSKKHLVLTLLWREDGATVDDIMAATGWQRHTVRAAISRLRRQHP
jgi:hypothetical protein